MWKNYFKIAFRHLWQTKLYSVINIAGLATGITCFLLALLFLRDEHSYDSFHRNVQSVYRITSTANGQTTGGTGQVQGPAFKMAVPEVQSYARVMGGSIYGDMATKEKALRQQLLFADNDFFQVFSFGFLHGNPATALVETGSIVISESTARSFFNTTDVVGRTIEMDADPSAQRLGKPLVVTGVVKDPPVNSSIRFDAVLPFSFLQLSFEDESWNSFYLGTFVKLRPGADPLKVAGKFNEVHRANAPKEALASYGLQPITDMHLNPLYVPGGSTEAAVINGSKPLFSWIFLGIAAFILLMAIINFVNLSMAGVMKRAKEVGVRKINGGHSRQIILQFLAESGLLCLLALILAVGLMRIALPLFNQLTEKNILYTQALDVPFFLYCSLMLCTLVLLTGAYPAMLLSRFKPAEVLRSRLRLTGNNLLGRSLIVVQFSLAVFLVIVTMLFYRQMDFVRTKDLGYNPRQVIRSNIAGNREVQPIRDFLTAELSKEPGVINVSFGAEFGMSAPVTIDGRELPVIHHIIDEHYLSAMNITLQQGHDFTPADLRDGVIVNESFVKAAGLQQPLGAQLSKGRYFDDRAKTIIGVVKDYHYGSLRERIQPMIMFANPSLSSGIWIKYDQSRQAQVLAAFETAYHKAMPSAFFQYHFVDELNAREYQQEQRWRRIITIAAALSVLICGFGLFALAHMSVQQRVREIGIRKVLGASASGIAVLFSKDLLKPLLPAFILAAPLAWYVMKQWLQQFAYQAGMAWWIFAAAGIFALLVALAAVSIQVVGAALANPLKSLRVE